MFVTTEHGFLPPGIWEDCLAADPAPATGGVLAVDSFIEESKYVGLRAVADQTGVVHVDLAFVDHTIAGCQRQLEEQLAKDPTLRLAVSPTLEGHVPQVYRPRTTVVGYAELLKSTGLVRSLIMEHRVVHHGAELLAEHVARAVAVRQQHALVLSSKKSTGSIALARCLVFAVSLASRPANNRRASLGIAR